MQNSPERQLSLQRDKLGAERRVGCQWSQSTLARSDRNSLGNASLGSEEQSFVCISLPVGEPWRCCCVYSGHGGKAKDPAWSNRLWQEFQLHMQPVVWCSSFHWVCLTPILMPLPQMGWFPMLRVTPGHSLYWRAKLQYALVGEKPSGYTTCH